MGLNFPDRLVTYRLGISTIRQVDHHLAHAACAFYQSPYPQSLIISYDGGGNDGTFKAFIGCRTLGIRVLKDPCTLNLGIPYRALAHPISVINKPDDGKERSNAGKLMGLTAYGKIRPEWIEPITDFYRHCTEVGVQPAQKYQWVLSHLSHLGSQLGVPLSKNALSGTDAFDLARTAQDVFENLLWKRSFR